MIVLSSDGDRNARFPWITLTLIGMNLAVFLVQLGLGEGRTEGLCLVPKEIVTGKDLVGTHKITLEFEYEDEENFDARGNPLVRVEREVVPVEQYPGPVPIYMTFLTSMFMHAGWLHLIGNMWFLWVFGRHVEHAMDHTLYLLFYVFCGVVASVVHIIWDPSSIIPCLGASGAISGVMAAYMSIYPFNQVRLWLGWFIGTVEVPAIFVIGGWLVLQYTFGYLELTNPDGLGGVAYGAHLGGFGAGFAFVWCVLGILYFKKNHGPPPSEEETMPAAVAPPPPVQVQGFSQAPQATFDVYNFGQYSARPTDDPVPQKQKPASAVDLGNFYPRR
jgi:membrane associated rhomboid family serine protease